MEQYPNTGQNPYGQPQPGNQGQYPNTGQNPYGQPPPNYPPQNPGTGQNPYGQPQQGYPEQYPNTGQNPYGQPPPSYPAQYPGTGQNPYGAPPQQGYPGTTPFGQPPTGYGAPPTLAPTPAPQRNNSRVIAGVVVGAVVLLLLVVGIVHVNGATGTAKGFFDDIFSYNYEPAFARICSDQQSAVRADFNSLESSLNQAKGQATIDASKLVYSLKSGGLTSAVVKVTGSYTVVVNVSGTAASQPIPISGNSSETDIHLNTSGLGWCIENITNA